MIGYGRQEVTQDDIKAVVRVLESDFLTQGPSTEIFEDSVRLGVGAKFAVATNSATSSLHIACLALGIGQGDVVWTSPISFVASANCALYCGANIDFVDIDAETWNISWEKLEEKLRVARAKNQLPKVLISVHFAGSPVAQEKFWVLSKEYGFKIIEDASHSLGASRNDEAVGSCKWSDITIFSFHPVKIITTGEGGMALTNNAILADKMRMLRSHGITRDSREFLSPSQGSWYYEQQLLGFNYRMSDINAALGTSQFARLRQNVTIRNQLARRYLNLLLGLPFILQKIDNNSFSSYHLFVVRVPKAHKDELFNYLLGSGIGVNLHYYPIHLQPFYKNLGFVEGDFPEAERYSKEAITLPLHTQISVAQLDFIANTIIEWWGVNGDID